MVLQADPAGKGFLPMGCLDHHGYSMADPKHFYQHMILELVTNKINHSTYHKRNLNPIANFHGRSEVESWNPTARNAINQHKRICVMYSKAKFARGKISRCMEIDIDPSAKSFWEANANAERGEVRPKFIAVPMPKPGEEPYVWIDMAWPIRSILLPVAQNVLPGTQSQCAYVQINFRSLEGKIATSGFYEDKNQGYFEWKGDESLGLFWDHSPATMRVDTKMMYEILLMPRGRREIDDVLAPFQLHRWDNVPYSPLNYSDKNVCYEVDRWRTCISDVGLPLDVFLSRLHGVSLQYTERKPSQIASIVDNVIGFGLGFVPIVGPLLVYFTTEAINAIEDPGRYDKIMQQVGLNVAGDIAKPLLESIIHFGLHSRKKFTRSAEDFSVPLAFADDLAEYKRNPEAFAWEIPAEELIFMEDGGEDKEDKEADQETKPKVALAASVAPAEA